jgi:hypothetical protein
MIKPISIGALQTFFFIAIIDYLVASIGADTRAARFLSENTSHNQQRSRGVEIEHGTARQLGAQESQGIGRHNVASGKCSELLCGGNVAPLKRSGGGDNFWLARQGRIQVTRSAFPANNHGRLPAAK